MGQVIKRWRNVTDFANKKIFNGDEDTIDVLWSVSSNGKLIDGKYGAEAPETDSESELRANIGKAFFGYYIPALWQVSGTHAFVIDSGYACGEDKPLDEYLEDDTMDATGACVDGTLYYLVYPDGDSTTWLPSALGLQNGKTNGPRA
ncbi:hypothetical protein E8E14_009990 [Neopestalotiopsis sp. 37M]|nr:hypothetical protein E8E14_009990 [Neopestalotiopsis sp. 37M]